MRTSKNKQREIKTFIKNYYTIENEIGIRNVYLISREMVKLIKNELHKNIDIRTVEKYYLVLRVNPTINRRYNYRLLKRKGLLSDDIIYTKNKQYWDSKRTQRKIRKSSLLSGTWYMQKYTDENAKTEIKRDQIKRRNEEIDRINIEKQREIERNNIITQNTSNQLIKDYRHFVEIRKIELDEILSNNQSFNGIINELKNIGITTDGDLEIHIFKNRHETIRIYNLLIEIVNKKDWNDQKEIIKEFENSKNNMIELLRSLDLSSARNKLKELSDKDAANSFKVIKILRDLRDFITIVIDRLKLEIQQCEKNKQNYQNKKRKEKLSKQLDIFNNELMLVENGSIPQLGKFET